MDPDAIIVLTDGAVRLENGLEGAAGFRSTTYEERDKWGTLGGSARVEAAARLAARYTKAAVVTTSKRGDDPVSHAQIAARELEELGVARERVILEERSENTIEQLQESFALAEARGWHSIALVSNEYHMARIRAFCEHMLHPSVELEFVAAEAVLEEGDPSFKERYGRVKQTEAYQERLASEAAGVDAITRGNYQPTNRGDKQERRA